MGFPDDLLLSQPYADADDKALVLLHTVGALWAVAALGAVGEKLEAPLERASQRLGCPELAGLTVMALGGGVGTLALCIVSTSVAASDLGLGAVLGGSALSLLLTTGACGLAAASCALSPAPLLRDGAMAVLGFALMGLFAEDGKIQFWEAAVMLAPYLLLLMASKVRGGGAGRGGDRGQELPVLQSEAAAAEEGEADADEEGEGEEEEPLCTLAGLPLLPITLLLRLTAKGPFTVVACLLWTAVLAWLAVWWSATVAATLSLHPLLVGFVLLGAGGQLPEVVAAVSVARRGFADMALSSSIGSTWFASTVLLPLAWLIEGLSHSGEAVQLQSDHVSTYALSLAAGAALLLLVLRVSSWTLGRASGAFLVAAFVCYVIGIVMGSSDES